MRRVSLLLPINSQRKLLLQHRDNDAPIKPNLWAFFGGHIELNETAEEAAKRELFEELQEQAFSLNYYFTRVFKEPWGEVERNFFSLEINISEAQLRSQQQEGDDLAFFSLQELFELDMTDNDRLIAIKFLEELA